MKEQYIAPELKRICLAPVEKLARSTVDFDDLLQNSSQTDSTSGVDIDIDVNLGQG